MSGDMTAALYLALDLAVICAVAFLCWIGEPDADMICAEHRAGLSADGRAAMDAADDELARMGEGE